MADLSITASNVSNSATAIVTSGTAGSTITAGQLVYQDTTDNNRLKLASHSTQTPANAYGISLNGASAGQPLSVIRSGVVNIGGTTTVGETYYVSSTAGGIAPSADIGTGDYVTVIGIGVSTTDIKVLINASGVAHA